MLRYVPFCRWLPRKKDQHVPGRPLPRIFRHERRQTVLALVVGDDEGVQEVAVLHLREAVLGSRLAVRNPSFLSVGVQRRDAAPCSHVGAAEEGGHGVVDAVSVHALQGRLAENLRRCHGAQVEDGADPPTVGIVEVRPRRDWYLVQYHVLEQQQSLEDRVELQVVFYFREMSDLVRIMSFEVLGHGECKRLEFEAADVLPLRVETKAAIL